jgi:hypothetical protein
VPYCANCGRDLSPAAQACPNCGHPGPAAAQTVVAPQAAPPGPRTEGFAIASLVCGIAAFFFIPLVGSILAIALGSAARKRIAEDPDLQGAEMARAGIIIGWVGVALVVLAVVFLITLAFAFQHSNL